MFLNVYSRETLTALILDIFLTQPKIIGPKERFNTHKSAQKNNYIVNTNSGNVTLEADVFFGKNVSLITGTHDYKVFGVERIQSFPTEGRDIIVETGAWIGSNSIVLGPCIVGRHSVVAAGSVVVKDVPPFSIVAGNPARVIKMIQNDQ